MVRAHSLIAALLVVAVRLGAASEDYDAYDDMGGMGGDMDGFGEDGYGGMGDDDYAPPPPTPPSEELDGVEAFDKFLDNEDASVIGAFPAEDEEAMEAYKSVAEALQYDWRWAHTTNTELLTKLKVKKGALFLYRSPKYVSEKYGDKKRERFPSEVLSENAVKNWLLSKAQPLVGQWTYQTKERYHSKGLPTVLIFCDVDWEKSAKVTNYYVNRARKVAANYKGKLQFAVAKMSDYDYQLADFGLAVEDKAHDVRMGIVHKKGTNEYYYGSEETKFSGDALAAFAEAYLKGEVEAAKVVDLTSPPPSAPDDDDDGDVDESAVVTLTGDNFDEVVNDASKDVLVEFYAPWCGHCKMLKPQYAQAAASLADTPSVVLAKMDATEHDPPAGFDVQGYPTIYFVPAESGAKPAPYEGEREAADIVSWLKSNAKSLQ